MRFQSARRDILPIHFSGILNFAHTTYFHNDNENAPVGRKIFHSGACNGNQASARITLPSEHEQLKY